MVNILEATLSLIALGPETEKPIKERGKPSPGRHRAPLMTYFDSLKVLPTPSLLFLGHTIVTH